MKNLFTLLSLIIVSQQVSALTFYDQLCAFNPNWNKYKNENLLTEARLFNSDCDYIYAHLSSVLPILKSNTPTDLNANQVQMRSKLIDLLDRYRKARNFPINYYRSERIPVFIDEHNTHCAVGFLMQQSGSESLAKRISEADNYVWVKDISDPQVLEWQELSGFSLEELKLIQGAYDSYLENAFFLPNKYEIPQKPSCMTAYFDNQITGKPLPKKAEHLWCFGEGYNGVLNGRWIQNYGVGIPWIVGYYEKGKRTGKWEEYYQGTKLLCRTENWRDDKLNGIRKRFDRTGKIIEEILFRDGNAITKTNYDFKDSLIWIRKPLESDLVWTEVFNFGGAMIAAGKETVYNPGNLLWFQNIELTMLNSVAITARSNNENLYNSREIFSGTPSFQTPPLVEYKKQGNWIFYKENAAKYLSSPTAFSLPDLTVRHYSHFGVELNKTLMLFEDLEITQIYDSIQIEYKDNQITHFFGYGNTDFTHLYVTYREVPVKSTNIYFRQYDRFNTQDESKTTYLVKEIGQYNKQRQKIGTWKHFDSSGQLYKIEQFILPRNEDEE